MTYAEQLIHGKGQKKKCQYFFLKLEERALQGRVGYVSMQGNLQDENYNCIRIQYIITKSFES